MSFRTSKGGFKIIDTVFYDLIGSVIKRSRMPYLTLYIVISVSIFSKLFSIHFLWH